ncbi:MAG: xanthine dehydrogenase family protein molybdopterin-binding subunit, partial [Actinomycetia bacterium]|nr:xanthine dehydrogenase family protein molybdopterin-binding subunit [Actinomycetes bacterium]
MTRRIDRRTFIKSAATGGGGLALTLLLGSCTDDESPASSTTATATTSSSSSPPTTSPVIGGDPNARWEANLLLRIDGDGSVTVVVPKSEMGQGVKTALAMVVAEELDAEWSSVRIETAPAARTYGDQVTGGSLSVSTRFESMRRIGATARHMLVAAAAEQWGVDPVDCVTEPGVVRGPDSGQTLGYGQLASFAAQLDTPSSGDVLLKDPSDFRIIGTGVGAVDAPEIVSGAAIYGSDVVVPNMVIGVVARSPVFGGRVVEFADTAARSVPGVIDVAEVSTGVAVVAENTWAALRGRDALAVTWDGRGNEALDDATIRRRLLDRLDPVAPTSNQLTALYTFPFFAHSAIEPLACVADATSDHCDVSAATQHPQLARAVAARGARLPTDDVTLTVPLIGGGFGRRLDQDFVEEAVEVSAAVGRPVKLVWSRTDDLRRDRYHPASVCRAIGDPTRPEDLHLDMQLAWSESVPTGNWRSVTEAPDAFARECFIDELAHAAGADPYDYRRPLLNDRELATLDLAAGEAGWGDPLPAGWGRGIAHQSMWGVTPTTMVAEVSVEGDAIRVERIVCAIDCGIVVNPDTVVAQMEGAVAFGLTATLHGGVTIADGGV